MSTIVDDWVKDFDIIDESANDLMHKLNQRNQYPINTQPYAKSDLHIKELYRKFQQQVGQLQERLNHLSILNRITQRESERRQRLVDNLNKRCKQVEFLINNPDCDRRSALFTYNNYQSFNTNSNETPTVGWNDLDVEAGTSSNDQSVTQLKETKQLLLQEQEKGMENLSSIITRQKYLAQNINSEINLHNEILEDITGAFEDTDERLSRNIRNVRVVDKKTGTCGYWTVIIFLLIAIVVLCFV